MSNNKDINKYRELFAINKNKIEKYIEKISKDIQRTYQSEFNNLYRNVYKEVDNNQLKQVFSIFHYELNHYIGFLNSKLHSRLYNANESREFKFLIQFIRSFQIELEESEYKFDIDESYDQLLKKCISFLQDRHGSGIPEDLNCTQLIEDKPVFSLSKFIKVNKPNASESYKIEEIGEGSYATVHRYKDSYYDRYFVIKRAKSDLTPKEIERFSREFKVLASLKSPYIVEVYNYESDKNQYTMEYLDETLEKYIDKNVHELSTNKKIRLINQIFKAFTYLHSMDHLHRDISYTNILVKHYKDSTVQLKVSDFGLVKIPGSSLTLDNSKPKGSLNDPGLNRTGFKNYEKRHETYALTFVINYILCGRKHTIGTYPSMTVTNFMERGTHPDIEQRFSNIEEMIREFNEIKSELD
ncbi:protein kinase [Priestia aryabhattai]|uniref:protein kinase domain-containing protein n=1 Tax=Priestia aryabhattai TaxID=412384 RepID=UPI003D2B3F4D